MHAWQFVSSFSQAPKQKLKWSEATETLFWMFPRLTAHATRKQNSLPRRNISVSVFFLKNLLPQQTWQLLLVHATGKRYVCFPLVFMAKEHFGRQSVYAKVSTFNRTTISIIQNRFPSQQFTYFICFCAFLFNLFLTYIRISIAKLCLAKRGIPKSL